MRICICICQLVDTRHHCGAGSAPLRSPQPYGQQTPPSYGQQAPPSYGQQAPPTSGVPQAASGGYGSGSGAAGGYGSQAGGSQVGGYGAQGQGAPAYGQQAQGVLCSEAHRRAYPHSGCNIPCAEAASPSAACIEAMHLMMRLMCVLCDDCRPAIRPAGK